MVSMDPRIKDHEKYDIIWLAVDTSGNIIVAQSLKVDIPEFVKADADKTITLCKLLCLPDAIRSNRPKGEFDSEKYASLYGFYCYAADSHSGSVYRLVEAPSSPSNISDLSGMGKMLLSENHFPFCAADTKEFSVNNGSIIKNLY